MATAVIAVVGTEVAKLAVKTALGSLVKLIQYERFLDKTVKNGLKRLETELKMMQASIENVLSVPQDQINLVDKFWASEVKELSREIETRLQSFMSRIESTKGTFLSVGSRQVINHQIASFIKDIMMEAKQVSDQRGRYGFSSSNTSFAKKVDPRIYALYKNESDLVGLVGATNELTKMMSNCNHVSIVGMGGLGKTTLARAVYEQMKGEFDCCAFVPVGQYANDKKVLMDILHDLRIEIYGREPDERQLINQLRDAIDGQRCLFVIDDIWDKDTWTLIQCALVGSPESRIITTTRKLEVAKAVGDFYMIKTLSDANSKELLHTRIFGAKDKSHDTEFHRMSDKILSKCCGVPIAIITIASLLSKKPMHEWSKVYDSIGFAEHEKEDVVKSIRIILSFSYYDLPYHLRRCFLYLCLFPEDHWIEKNMLIWRWVAEGLVPGSNEQMVGLFELGETYFNELIDRSMIQRAVSPRDLGQGGCRVHDMMLDIIRDQSSSAKENFSIVLDGKREGTSQSLPIHRLAIHENRLDENQNNIPTPQENPNTSLEVGRVLSFYASSCAGTSLPQFSKFALLRVMDLEYCDLSVGDHKLKNLSKSCELAYIGLLGTPVAELPKKITRLKHLQTLDVTATGIKELPPFVEELRKLRCLRAGKGTRMMGRVGELKSLEELWLHSADKSPDFALELQKLEELRVLVVHFDKMDKGMQEALVKSLSVLKKLQVLQVWFDDNEKVCLPSWEYSVSYLKLRQLLLFGVIVPSQMSWIHNLYVPELTKLLLEAEVLKAQDLEILGEMSSLRSLYLHSKEYRRMSYTASKEEFKVLEYLNTNIELVCGDGALPMIKELEVSGIKVGTDVGLKGNMPLLERASYHLDCNGCILVQIDKAEAALRQASEAHPNHPTLYIKRYGNYNVPLELLHQIKQSADQEFFAGGSLGLGEGGQGQASASNATSNFFKNMTELLTPFIGIPPTFTLDGATDGMASTSQSAGGVPPRRQNGEGQVLLTTNPTFLRKALQVSSTKSTGGKPQYSSEDRLAGTNIQSLANVLSSMAIQRGMDPSVTHEFAKNVMEKCNRNPVITAILDNMELNADGSTSASDVSTLLQLTRQEINSYIREKILLKLPPNTFARAAATEELSDASSEINDDSLVVDRADSLIAENAVPGITVKDASADADYKKRMNKMMQNFVKSLRYRHGSWPGSGQGAEAKSAEKHPEESSGASVSCERTPKPDNFGTEEGGANNDLEVMCSCHEGCNTLQ